MRPLDVVRAKDGSLSLTKLQASCFHLALFVTVCYITWKTGEFKQDMWSLYAITAVGHAVVDKTAAQVSEFKNKQADKESETTIP